MESTSDQCSVFSPKNNEDFMGPDWLVASVDGLSLSQETQTCDESSKSNKEAQSSKSDESQSSNIDEAQSSNVDEAQSSKSDEAQSSKSDESQPSNVDEAQSSNIDEAQTSPERITAAETMQEPKIFSIWGDPDALNNGGVSSNVKCIDLYKSLFHLHVGRFMTGSEEPGPSYPSNHQNPSFYSNNISAKSTSNDHGMPSYNNRHGVGFYGNITPRRLNFSSLRGRILSLAQCRAHSGDLCNAIEQGLCLSEIDTILSDISTGLCELMESEVGSRFVKKLFRFCSSDQMILILKTITKNPNKLIQICVNPYGSKSMLRLLENVTTPEKMQFITINLSRGAVLLCNDMFGNRVVKHCVRTFPPLCNQHLFNAIAHNCYEIATHRIGCIVLKACLKNSSGHGRVQLISAIIAMALTLAEDPYGNYVVQQLIELEIPQATQDILHMFEGHLASLSCDKHASNVVQKLISLPEDRYISLEIITELVICPEFSSLVIDPFANYVIQSALSASKGFIHHALVEKIEENRRSMELNKYGEKILDRLKKRRDIELLERRLTQRRS